jgi:predicted nucleic acid-binding protein
VSALLSPHGIPAQVLALTLAGEVTLLLDERILAEYSEVLSRPRLAIPPAKADKIVQQLELDGSRILATPFDGSLPDPDDRAFVEVALSGHADALVTGNARHFPSDLGIVVLSPRAFLEGLEPR